MTVDGVIEVGEWYVAEGGHDRASRGQFDGAAGMLLGRKTYEGLAAYWSPLTGDWADLLNPLPKFIASRTLPRVERPVIEGDVAQGVSRLKELDGDLIGIGCGDLAGHLVTQGLVDELRFWVHPAIAGRGAQPFHGDQTIRLRLLGSTTFDSGVTLLRHEPVPTQAAGAVTWRAGARRPGPFATHRARSASERLRGRT